MTSRHSPLLLPLLSCLLAGCISVGPDYVKKDFPVPSRYVSLQQGTAKGDAVGDELMRKWWKVFDDSVLENLMEKATRQNLDVRIATARVRQARARAMISSAALLPEGGLRGDYERVRRPEEPFIAPDQKGRYQSLYLAGFDASWEIDVFGGVRRDIEAFLAALEASHEGLRDTLITLQAEVGRNYIEVRGIQHRLAIARQEVAIRQENVEITEARSKAGLVSELDWARAQGELANTEAVIPSLERALKAAIHRLEVLLGQEPGSIEDTLAGSFQLPRVPSDIPVGLPSDLLRRRPDIRKAERELAEATARIGVSTADLFPRFSLTGSFGYEADQPGRVFRDPSNFWLINPALRWPILNFRRILAQIDSTKAVREETLARYEKTVLLSLEEVENALVALSREELRVKALSESVRANDLAVRLAKDRYLAGIQSYLAVIDAQRALYFAEDQLAQSRQNQALALVALYKALGGGWQYGD